MKNKIILFGTLAMFFAVSSCKKNEPANNNLPTGKKGSIVCKYNGANWESRPLDTTQSGWRQIAGYTSLAFNELGVDTFGLAGWENNSEGLLNIKNLPVNSQRIGSYTFDSDKSEFPNIFFTTNDTAILYGMAQKMYHITGKLSITKFDRPGKVCSGTFEIFFTPKDARYPKVVLSEGTFTDIFIANEL
jgi:hypothetical protein